MPRCEVYFCEADFMIVIKKLVREIRFFLFWVQWSPLGFLIRKLPWWCVYRLAEITGTMAYWFQLISGSRIVRGIGRFFPEKSRSDCRQIARRTCQQWFMVEYENMRMERFIAEEGYQSFPVAGLEHLDHALQRGKGAIVLIVHFGAHFQIMPVLGRRGYVVNQLSNDISQEKKGGVKPGYFEVLCHAAREKYNGRFLSARMITAGKFARSLYRYLANNEVVIIAIDGRTGSQMDGFPFLGVDRYLFSTGAAALAVRTGAAVLPSFTVRDNQYRNHLVIEEELVVPEEAVDHPEQAVSSLTAAFVMLLENYVRAYPDHCGQDFFVPHGKSGQGHGPRENI